ncbi:uncharacterized protein METZ01_LOCUS262739, partial [marine metagenome]
MSEKEVEETVSDEDKENSAKPLPEALPESTEEVSEETPVSEAGGKDVDASENSSTKEKKEETAKDLLGT